MIDYMIVSCNSYSLADDVFNSNPICWECKRELFNNIGIMKCDWLNTNPFDGNWEIMD